ncbi:HAD-IA family hydrolase [Pilimelia columellifera]|uniref:Hydrolase of the HAD superfamily n=1 Tax=Pilimelia columellifera subsp. columellifera TaxID=706583 RepID=A0ABP6ACE9_9ACTN
MRRENATALLIDFDGVLRRYDPAHTAAVEVRHGLEPGEILAAGLHGPRLLPAITGHATRAQWRSAIADSFAERVGGPAAALAMVDQWGAYRGEIVAEALAFVREVRAAGRPVALTSNATDDLRDDLRLLGVADEFDAVVSSAEVGHPKPAPEFFAAACAAVGALPKHCLFVDDAERNVRGARSADLPALRWSGPADLPYLRAAMGL